MTSSLERIGIYGGTFDPVHNAHLAMARAARDQAGLDRVLFVVSAHPPHKGTGPVASAEDRYAMVCAALDGESRFEASRMELDRQGPSYTADTLDIVTQNNPRALLFLIVGMDSLDELPRWRRPDNILARAHLLAIPRPGEWRIPDALKDRYTILEFDQTALSSTEIRACLASGLPVDDFVPAGVLDIIHDRRIYAAC